MGGMAAFIPSRGDEAVNGTALITVRDDKTRESNDGFDGSWVARPNLVPVCQEVFDGVLGDQPNQLAKQRPEAHTTAADLLAISKTPGQTSEAGLRNDVSVGLQYLAQLAGGERRGGHLQPDGGPPPPRSHGRRSGSGCTTTSRLPKGPL
jgi:malate synthase